MALYCDTAELPAICAGTAKMRKIDSETLTLALELEKDIQAMKEGEITLVVQHGWVSAVNSFVRRFRKRLSRC